MPVYAVTGASGHLGRFAIERLLALEVPPKQIVALVRDPRTVTNFERQGVFVREADYSRPKTLEAALVGVDRLLLVSSSQQGQLVAQHSNVIAAACKTGVSRIAYTSMLNADDSTSPLAGEHRDTERVLREAGVPYTLLRNGYYTEVYTDPLGQYLEDGEILGSEGSGKLATAPRSDYAQAAAVALLGDEEAAQIYELGGDEFSLPEFARTVTEVTGVKVTYRGLTGDEYVQELQRTGVDEPTARFVAALDASIARGDIETSSHDLAHLLGRPATPLSEVVRAAYELFKVKSKAAVIGFIGAGMIGGTVAGLAIEAGYEVVLSNSRGPESLSNLVEELGPRAHAATPAEAAKRGDIVIVTIPLKAYRDLPVKPLAGKVVIDTTNYVPDRDGHIADLDDRKTTTSELVQAHLPDSHVVKALNTMMFKHLGILRRPQGAADRSAMPIASDDDAAKQTVSALLEAIGFDAYDLGPLHEGWRLQVGTLPYAYGVNGSFEHPQSAGLEQLSSMLDETTQDAPPRN